jgi:hypothetical protein
MNLDNLIKLLNIATSQFQMLLLALYCPIGLAAWEVLQQGHAGTLTSIFVLVGLFAFVAVLLHVLNSWVTGRLYQQHTGR